MFCSLLERATYADWHFFYLLWTQVIPVRVDSWAAAPLRPNVITVRVVSHHYGSHLPVTKAKLLAIVVHRRLADSARMCRRAIKMQIWYIRNASVDNDFLQTPGDNLSTTSPVLAESRCTTTKRNLSRAILIEHDETAKIDCTMVVVVGLHRILVFEIGPEPNITGFMYFIYLMKTCQPETGTG